MMKEVRLLSTIIVCVLMAMVMIYGLAFADNTPHMTEEVTTSTKLAALFFLSLAVTAIVTTFAEERAK